MIEEKEDNKRLKQMQLKIWSETHSPTTKNYTKIQRATKKLMPEI